MIPFYLLYDLFEFLILILLHLTVQLFEHIINK